MESVERLGFRLWGCKAYGFEFKDLTPCRSKTQRYFSAEVLLPLVVSVTVSDLGYVRGISVG